MYIDAYFESGGVPKTGLSPTISIYDAIDKVEEVHLASMTEIGNGHYTYEYGLFDSERVYAFIADGGAALDDQERYSIGAFQDDKVNGQYVVAYFVSYGIPATGLSPTITIREIDTGVLKVDAEAMDEIGSGFYMYSFLGYSNVTPYAVTCDGGDTLEYAERYVACTIGETEQASVPGEIETFPDLNVIYGSSKKVKPRVLRNDFGDGYSQRAGDGINLLAEQWNVSFRLRLDDADTLEAFFKEHKGHKVFYWTPPRQSSARKFTVQEWTRKPDKVNGDVISARFKEEFDL